MKHHIMIALGLLMLVVFTIQAVEAFKEQIEGLKAGGIDIVWIETMSAADEIRAAAEAERGW